jgi:hypothetical protein
MVFPANWLILTNDAGLIAELGSRASPANQGTLILWTDDHRDLSGLLIR